MFLIILFCLIIALIFSDYFWRKRKCKLAAGIPGPPCYPLIGNALILLRTETAEDATENMFNLIHIYGKIVRFWIGHYMVFLTTDPKVLEVILSSPRYIRKNTIYQYLSAWLGDGLLLSNGRKWFQRRKALTPTFHFKILEKFVEVFDEQSAVLIDCLKNKLNKGAFDIVPFITLCTLDIISETAMGTKINVQLNPNCEYARAVHEMTNITMQRMSRPYTRYEFTFSIIAPLLKRKQKKTLKILHNFTRGIINQRRESLLRRSIPLAVFSHQDEYGSKRKLALLDILLQSTVDGKPLSDADIQEEVDTFMFEGHDTTTSGISFALYCLGRNPDIQARVFAEIREVIGDDPTKSVTLNDLNDLKYLELVIKESMRMYPPVPMIGRKIEEDLHFDGKTIPKGSDFGVPLYILFRDPDIFPNPDQFDPQRHSFQNTVENVNPYAYIPFSAGPRNCIGQRFAMLEMKYIVSKIIRHYELRAVGEEPKTVKHLVMRPKNGINMEIKQRAYE